MADADEGACAACGSEAWIDLAHNVTAASLREHEANSPVLGKWGKRFINASLAAVFTVSVGLGVALSSVTLPVIGSVVSLITGVSLVRSLRQPFAQALEARRADAQAPVRRRLALPPAAGLSGRVQGVALPESTLRTVLDDRPCLARRVRARLIEDDNHRERLVIDDTRSAAFELAGHRFEADQVSPDAEVARSLVSELGPEARARAIRFLRERGCFSHEGSWVIEEQWVAAHAPVEVEGRGREGAPVIRRNDDATSSPYRG